MRETTKKILFVVFFFFFFFFCWFFLPTPSLSLSFFFSLLLLLPFFYMMGGDTSNVITTNFCGPDGWEWSRSGHSGFPLSPCVREIIIVVPTALYTMFCLIPLLLSLVSCSLRMKISPREEKTWGHIVFFLVSEVVLILMGVVAAVPSPVFGNENNIVGIYILTGAIQCFAVGITISIITLEWLLFVKRSWIVNVFFIGSFVLLTIQIVSVIGDEIEGIGGVPVDIYIQYVFSLCLFALTMALYKRPHLVPETPFSEVKKDDTSPSLIPLVRELCRHLSWECISLWLIATVLSLNRGVFLILSEFKIGQVGNAIVEDIDNEGDASDVASTLTIFTIYTAIHVVSSFFAGFPFFFFVLKFSHIPPPFPFSHSFFSSFSFPSFPFFSSFIPPGLLYSKAVALTIGQIRYTTADSILFSVKHAFAEDDLGLSVRNVLTSDCEKVVSTSIYPFRIVFSALSALLTGGVLLIQGNIYFFLGNVAAVAVIISIIFLFNTFVISSLAVGMSKKSEKLSQMVDEILGCLSTILFFNQEQYEQNRFDESSKRASRSFLKKSFIEFGGELLQWTLGYTWMISMMLVSWRFVVVGFLEPDQIFSFLILGIQMLHSSLLVATCLPLILSLAGPLDHIVSLLSISEDDDPKPSFDPSNNSLDVRTNSHLQEEKKRIPYNYRDLPGLHLDHVDFIRFSMEGEEKRILSDINLNIRPGEFVAIVGESGAGKSTLLNIIMGFLKPSNGEVYVTGAHNSSSTFDEMERKDFSDIVGVLEQRPAVFRGTIGYNLTYGLPYNLNLVDSKGQLEEPLVKVLKEAALMDLVQRVGVDYEVGVRGKKLSVGQNQRLCLARVLLRNPKLLVLDEATSALDQYSEREIMKALDQRRERGMTMVVVAHRIHTIEKADKIIVLKRGRIVACDTHEKLLESSATYQKICTEELPEAPNQTSESSEFDHEPWPVIDPLGLGYTSNVSDIDDLELNIGSMGGSRHSRHSSRDVIRFNEEGGDDSSETTRLLKIN